MSMIEKQTPWYFTPAVVIVAGRLAGQGAIGAYRELPLNPTIAGCFALADAKIAEYTGP
jgi:hypothetical protein